MGDGEKREMGRNGRWGETGARCSHSLLLTLTRASFTSEAPESYLTSDTPKMLCQKNVTKCCVNRDYYVTIYING